MHGRGGPLTVRGTGIGEGIQSFAPSGFRYFLRGVSQAKNRVFVYQIYYDEASRNSLDPGFIPLDNSLNERPDWYEFWPIRNYLKKNQPLKDAWYGFLSPKFIQKTGFTSSSVLSALEKYDERADAALFTVGWDQLAYFLNPFEQGEAWHPGLLKLSQLFFDRIGLGVDLTKLVTYSRTSVLSNYIIAKPKFWDEWLSMADKFYEIVEGDAGDSELNRTTSYGSTLSQTPIKTFIQERFASVILARGQYKALAVESQNAPIFTRVFKDDQRVRRMLQACDLLKERYCLTQDIDYLNMYQKIRKDIEFIKPRI